MTIKPNEKTKAKNNIVTDVTASTALENSALAMPDRCRAQLDIYRKALAEEEQEDNL